MTGVNGTPVLDPIRLPPPVASVHAEQFWKYVGLPFRDRGRDFSGVDCWGIVYLIYRNEFKIALPRYDDFEYHPERADREELEKVFNFERDSGNWYEIPANSAHCGDVLLFRIDGLNTHVGLVVYPRHMIHVLEGNDSNKHKREPLSAIERYDSMLWRNRMLSVHRYIGQDRLE